MVESWCELYMNGERFDSEQILSVTHEDKDGSNTDYLSLRLLPNVPKPKPSTKLTFFLVNSVGEFLDCGIFYVQSVTRTKNEPLHIRATSVEFSETQKKKHSRHYKDTTLSSIVNIVGKELSNKVKFKAPNIRLKSVNQTDETYISFLNRLAKEYDALFSIKKDVIYFVSKNSDTLPKYTIYADNCSDISITHSTKTFYQSCKMKFRDRKKAEWQEVLVESGSPVLEVKCSCQSKEEARLKATNELRKRQRGTVTGNLTTLGQKIYAGTHLDLKNTYEKEDDDTYYIKSVSHRYTHAGGWVCSVDFENFKLKGK
jgi:phage protein D